MNRVRFKQLLFWLLAGAFAWLVFNNLSELRQLGRTLLTGQWQWVLLAAGVQLLYYVTIAVQYQAAFTAVEMGSDWRRLLSLVFAALFVNSTAPAGGATGMAIFMDDAVRRGYPPARATVGFLLVLATTLGTFSLLLLAGMATLLRAGRLTWLEAGGSLLLFSYVIALTATVLLGFYRPLWLRRLLDRVQRVVDRVSGLLRRPGLLPATWAEGHAEAFARASTRVARYPRQLTGTLLTAAASHLLALFSLYLLFRAFRLEPEPIQLLAGYTMTVLFTIISPTPGGAGVVEVLLPAIYVSLGLPLAPATAVTLSYRALNYWLPLLAGFLTLRQLPLFRPPAAPPSPRLAWLPAILTGLMGLLNLLSVATPWLAARTAPLDRFSPLSLQHESSLVALVAGLSLLALGYLLARRSRPAWWLALAILSTASVAHLWRQPPGYVEAGVALLLVLYLLVHRRLFLSSAAQSTF